MLSLLVMLYCSIPSTAVRSLLAAMEAAENLPLQEGIESERCVGLGGNGAGAGGVLGRGGGMGLGGNEAGGGGVMGLGLGVNGAGAGGYWGGRAGGGVMGLGLGGNGLGLGGNEAGGRGGNGAGAGGYLQTNEHTGDSYPMCLVIFA